MKEGHPEMSELRELDTRSLREKKKKAMINAIMDLK